MQNSRFKSFDDLKKQSDLPHDYICKFNKTNCDTNYDSFLKLLYEGFDQKLTFEVRLFFLFRAGAVASLILKKSDFDKFKQTKGRIFHQKYEQCLNEIAKLSKRVELLYEKKEEPKYIPIPQPLLAQVTLKRESLFIDPKELVRTVTQQKKCAVVFDYRVDKSQTIIHPTVPSFIVISVDYSIIVPGLIFNGLSTRLHVGQRPLLSKVFEADLIVFMEEKDPTIENGNLLIGSRADILRRAIVDYQNKKLGDDKGPFIMRGGFDNFKLVYPTYVSSDHHNKGTDLDDLDVCINDYKKILSHVVYPDLSILVPQEKHREIPSKPEPVVRKETTFDVTPNIPTSTATVPLPTAPTVNIIRPSIPPRTSAPTRPSQLSSLPSKQEVITDENKPPIPKHSPIIPPEQNNTAPKVSTAPFGPSIDRTSKPNGPDIRQAKPEFRPVPRNNAFSTIDRSTKPVRGYEMTAEEEKKCLAIYNFMITTTENESTRRLCTPGSTGLYNMGNTCFMNASLQALMHTPELINLFTKNRFLSEINPQNDFGTGGIISSVFSALLDLMWSGEFTAIRPRKFLSIFSKEVNSTLADGHQHDASEFQIFLLDALHEDTNAVHKRISFQQNYKGGANIVQESNDYAQKSIRFSNSPINRIFNLQMVSELECQRCRDRSVTFEDCSLITVELPHCSERHTSLRSCLDRHFSESGLDDWNCPKCKSRQYARRRTKLWKLPSILVVHLKRFSIVNGDYEKNDMYVEFDPEKLDLREFLHVNANSGQGNLYRLYAITNHRGRLSRGHYTALVAHAKTGNWMRMDDETVTPASCTAADIGDAYILFYKKVN